MCYGTAARHGNWNAWEELGDGRRRLLLREGTARKAPVRLEPGILVCFVFRQETHDRCMLGSSAEA
jgi:hypothetical protein